MITKGIVESILDKYTVKVSCPVYDKIDGADLYVNKLNTSNICSIAGCSLNLNIGDVVFVGFEDGNLANPVILGYLGIESKSLSDIEVISLNIENSLKLPKNTNIGDVTSFDIENLSNLSSNLQNQLNNIEKIKDDDIILIKDYKNKLDIQNNDIDYINDLLESCKIKCNNFIKAIGQEDDINKNTIYGRLNLYNKKIEQLNKSLGVVNDGIIISEELDNILSMYNNLVNTIVDTTPSLNTNSNYMLGRAEKIINTQWSPASSFKQWNSDKYFEANKTYSGMTYSLFDYGYKYDTWKKYANNNETYKGNIQNYGYREGPKYGSCCADFISEILGLPNHVRTCSGLINNSKYLKKYEGEDAKINNIKIGDSLVSSNENHIIWVGKIFDDSIVIYEQTPPLTKKTIISKNSTENGFLKYNNIIYKYILRPTEDLLNLECNKAISNEINISNNWIYKGNRQYGKFSEQRLTETEYFNNALVFWKLVKKAGWTAEAAAGAWSNTYAESTGNPWSYGTGGGGLFGFTPFDFGTTYFTGIYDYANDVLKDPEKRWNGDVQVDYINWQLKNIKESGWTGIFTIRQPETKYWNYIPPSNTRIPKDNFNLDTYVELNIKDYDATATICANLWLARYGVVDKTRQGRDLDKTITNHIKKAEELYQLFIKY